MRINKHTIKSNSSFRFLKQLISVNKGMTEYKEKPASYWQKKGERMALELFHYSYKNVPAYRAYMKKYNVNDKEIDKIENFKHVPIITKENYLRTANYQDLFPKKAFDSATTISATSGSTGEPFYFPRQEENDLQYEYMAEIFMRNQFSLDTKKTLGIIGFGLGIWIGGVFTYKNFNKIAQKGYNLTLIPVGVNKDLFLKSFKKFAPMYDQTILMGYPPFIKDVLDSGEDYGIKWKNYDLRILTAAEGYSENFRNYIAEKAGVKNIVNDIINMYGTVEQGTIAHETSFANLIRKIAVENPKIFKELFPKANNVPTLAQYYPQTIYFEEVNGVVVATGYGSSIPLVRYQFSDLGGVIGFDEIIEKLRKHGIDIYKEARKWKIDHKIMKLPFVYVYARSDFGVVFRGANIYPDEIKNALDQKALSKFVTGKFTMIKKEDKKFEQILEINVELKKGIHSSDQIIKMISDHVIKELRLHNSEYDYLCNLEKIERLTPSILLCNYQKSAYFTVTGKQLWVKK